MFPLEETHTENKNTVTSNNFFLFKIIRNHKHGRYGVKEKLENGKDPKDEMFRM